MFRTNKILKKCDLSIIKDIIKNIVNNSVLVNVMRAVLAAKNTL